MRKSLLTACCLAALSCATARPVPPPPGVELTAMNERINPCEDFYEYACGGWLESTSIPGDKSFWKRGYTVVAVRNMEAQRELLAEAARDTTSAPSTPLRKLGDYYGACMDEVGLENALPALRAELARLPEVKDVRTLAEALGQSQARGIGILFSLGATVDRTDAHRVVGELSQGGMGMPLPSHYLVDDAPSRAHREVYVGYLQRVFVLLGETSEQAARSAATVLELETALARVALSYEELRATQQLDVRLERSDLAARAPGLPWDVYFSAAGAQHVQTLSVANPRFFQEVARLARSVRPEDWKTYLTWQLTQGFTAALPKAFRDAAFQFDRDLSGVETERARWVRCVESTQRNLGESLAQVFIARSMDSETQARAQWMMREIEQSFARSLDTLEWMDAPTRAQALGKLKALGNRIGAPTQWHLEDTLQVHRDSFLKTLGNAWAFGHAQEMAKIGAPVDKSRWIASPLEANAFYYPPYNEVYFMAPLLQPPFFDKHASMPVNFGASGMTMGHELTHGLDDTGRRYDAQGNLRDWWTPASDKAFLERAECVKTQFSGYTAVGELKVNGAYTLGENLADLGGVRMAHAALEAWLAREPEVARQQARYRFTPQQQFFLGAAQARCAKTREAYARMQILFDPHPPERWRINGPLSNLPEFQRAFQCEAGAKMVRPPAERCEVW